MLKSQAMNAVQTLGVCQRFWLKNAGCAGSPPQVLLSEERVQIPSSTTAMISSFSRTSFPMTGEDSASSSAWLRTF